LIKLTTAILRYIFTYFAMYMEKYDHILDRAKIF